MRTGPARIEDHNGDESKDLGKGWFLVWVSAASEKPILIEHDRDIPPPKPGQPKELFDVGFFLRLRRRMVPESGRRKRDFPYRLCYNDYA